MSLDKTCDNVHSKGVDEKKYTLGSLFDGSGGFPLAGILTGIIPLWASEIEPFPIRVTTKRMPFMKHLGDISKINGAKIEPVDIITFGSPCTNMSVAGRREGLNGEQSALFYQAIRIIKEMREVTNGQYPTYAVWENVCFAAGTFVTCEKGYKPIETVEIGDKVKTLSGKYMPVAKNHKTRKQKVLCLKVSGGEDLTVTPNHPFYAREKRYEKGKRVISEPKWVAAGELTSNHLIGYKLDVPSLPDTFITEAEAWAIGRWLADGSIDLTKSNPRIFISVGNQKCDLAREMLNRLPYEIHENNPHATATNFTFTSREFYNLISTAGRGAGNKRVPNYIFGLPLNLQKEVLEGYISGDGYIRSRHIESSELSATTVSRELAYGIARLIRNCYHIGANITYKMPKNGELNGRVLHANFPSYEVTATITNKTTWWDFDGEILWQPVKGVTTLDKKEDVYNISVLEDNTYGANDVICHNCGAYSSNKGEDFKAVLEEIIKIKDGSVSVPMPESGKWLNAGEIVGDDYSVAWRTLDAQYHGVAQRRRRIFLVADFADKRAGNILFECEGMSGHITKGRSPWESPARSIEESVGTAGVAIPINTQIETRHKAMGEGTGFRVGEDGDHVFTLEADSHSVATEAYSIGNGQVDSLGLSDKARTLDCMHDAQAVLVLNDQGSDVMNVSKNVVSTLRAQEHGHQPIITEPITMGMDVNVAYLEQKAFALDSMSSNSMKSKNPHSGCREVDVAKTLDTSNPDPSKNQGGIAVLCAATQQGGAEILEDKVPAITAAAGMSGNNQPYVCSVENHPADSRVTLDESGTVQTLTSRMGTGGGNVPLVLNERQYALTVGEDLANTLTGTDYLSRHRDK